MVVICSFCNTVFQSKSSLNFHQKNAKFCLQLQGKQTITKSCEYCGKNDLSIRTSHDCPMRFLTEKFNEKEAEYKREIGNLQSTIEKLQEKLATKEDCIQRADKYNETITELAKKASTTSSTTHHTTIHNNNKFNIFTPLDLTEKMVNSILDQHLTTDVIGDGQKGLATMIHTHLLTDENGQSKYVCTDANRHHFRYLDRNGQPQRDPKAIHLTEVISKAEVGKRAFATIEAAFQTDEHRMSAYMPKAFELKALSHNNSKFRQQLACLATKIEEDENDSDEISGHNMEVQTDT